MSSFFSTERIKQRPGAWLALGFCTLVILLVAGRNAAASAAWQSSSEGTGDQQDQAGEDAGEQGAGQTDTATSSRQEAWEYWAYNVRVWIVTDQSPQIRERIPQLCSYLADRARVIDSASWQVRATPATSHWNWTLIEQIDTPEKLVYLTQKQIESTKQPPADKSTDSTGEVEAVSTPGVPLLIEQFSAEIDRLERERVDKLIVLRLTGDANYRIAAREYDLRTRTWGAKSEYTCNNMLRLGKTAYAAMENAFMPLARIEKVFDKLVEGEREPQRWSRVRVRALGLALEVAQGPDGSRYVVPNPTTPVRIRPTDVLRPVVRRVDKELKFESARVIDWTFLLVQEQDGSTLECRTRSKDRVPLSGKTGTRIDKLALVIRPPQKPTELQFVARRSVGDRNFKFNPLADYEVFSRSPDLANGAPSEPMGKTDVFGRIVIPPAEAGMRILYIRSGYRGLARLPLVPGLDESIVVELPNDEDRLHAEGIVRSLRNRITDLLAHRKLLETQIKVRLEQDRVAEAVELLEEFENLEDTSSLKARIDNQRNILITSGNESAARIDEMFVSLQATVEKFMPRSQADELRQMVQRARSNAGF